MEFVECGGVARTLNYLRFLVRALLNALRKHVKKLIAFLSLVLPLTVAGQGNSAEALKGIQRVQVIVDAAQFDDALRTPMELELRRTGLHVSSESSGEKVDAVITLHLQYEVPSTGQYSPVFARLSIERRTYLFPRPNSASIMRTSGNPISSPAHAAT